ARVRPRRGLAAQDRAPVGQAHTGEERAPNLRDPGHQALEPARLLDLLCGHICSLYTVAGLRTADCGLSGRLLRQRAVLSTRPFVLGLGVGLACLALPRVDDDIAVDHFDAELVQVAGRRTTHVLRITLVCRAVARADKTLFGRNVRHKAA